MTEISDKFIYGTHDNGFIYVYVYFYVIYVFIFQRSMSHKNNEAHKYGNAFSSF